MFRLIRQPFRPIVRASALAFLWVNRRDVARWARFAKRAASRSSRPSAPDLKLEARVRASVSADPVLRHDPSLRDLRVHDGVVTLETPPEWHNASLAVARLRQVEGVESVRTSSETQPEFAVVAVVASAA